MRLTYIIRAHAAPAQLERLVRRLDAPDARFLVHVNRRSEQAVFDEMRRRLADLPNVAWLPRLEIRWGGFSLVRATLLGVDAFLADAEGDDYAILLSGQDYPLRPPAELSAFFAEHAGTEFLSWFPLPERRWAREAGGLNRVRYWHTERIAVRGRLLRLPFPRRRFPAGLEPYGGMAFWCLTATCLAHVRAFAQERPDVVRFFEHVKFPDELFFQTIVMNSPLRERVRNDDLRYLDWSRGRAYPETLTAADLPRLVASGKLFARKFDPAVDHEILDLLDREVLHAA